MDMNKIFTGSKFKEIYSAFNELYNNFNYMNAKEYKELYLDLNYSDFLRCREYIYREPFFGLDHYRKIILNRPIDFSDLMMHYRSYSDFVNNALPKDSNQYEKYKSFLDEFEDLVTDNKQIINFMENFFIVDKDLYDREFYKMAWHYYQTNIVDILYKMQYILEDGKFKVVAPLVEILHVALYLNIEGINKETYIFIKNLYFNDDLVNKLMTSNIIKFFFNSENMKTKLMHNNNKALIDLINEIVMYNHKNTLDLFKYTIKKEEIVSGGNPVLDALEEDILEEAVMDRQLEIKKSNLLTEKKVLDLVSVFTTNDFMVEKEEIEIDPIISYLAERYNVEDKYSTYEEKLSLIGTLTEKINESIKETDSVYMEVFGSPNGGPSKVVANSVGIKHDDVSMDKKTKDDDDDREEYKPISFPHTYKDDEKEEEDDDDDDFPKFPNLKESADDKEDDEKLDLSIPEKPKGGNIFQRIQVKAMDSHKKYLKNGADAKRLGKDAKNAAKAVTKVPAGILGSITNGLKELDRMDDDRRKKYMIKPGMRKKWAKFLMVALSHYLVFKGLGPVFNIYLAILQKASSMKDTRIRSELVRELKAEIKVTEEKIEDAKSRDEKSKKYQLMRIKERLDAELARVVSNSEFI